MAMAPNEVEVKIPENMSPFVVIVNGVEYSYPAGTTQMVPEEVAEVIRQHVEAMPKPVAPSGGGGMVVHFTQIAPMDVEAEPQWVADKTHEEIVAAGNGGCNVIAIWPYTEGGSYYGDDVLHLSFLSAEFVGFNAFMLDPFGNFGAVLIYADGHVEVKIQS